MKFNKNKRIFLAMYTAMMSAVMLTGFASSTEAQEQSVAEAEQKQQCRDRFGAGSIFAALLTLS